MNGRIYTCDGCGRTGAVDERACGYECPVCRWVAPFDDRERASAWITWNSLFGRPVTKPLDWPHPWVQSKGKLKQGNYICEQAGDARTRWKRWYQWARFQRRLVKEKHETDSPLPGV